MSNPNAYGDPDTYHGQNWSFSSQDNGGVHTNSGVQNFWFYLLATGGSGVNDIGHNYSVEGVGLDAAGAIAYRNLTTYLGVNSQYDDARFYAIQAAYDLYGPCSQEAASTANAWHAVGIGYPYSNSITADFIPSSTGHCAVPHTVHFQNTSSHATSYQWNFGDGTTSSATHPNKTYSQAGTYTVTLIVQSSCGSDTLIMPDLIQVGPGAPCEVLMQSNTSNQFLSACYGSLLDDGGATGNYSDDVNHYVTIHSQGAANITLNFAQFNVQPGASVCVYDYLEVFDGVDPTAPSIGKYCNSNPPPASLTSSEDVVTVKFFSNSSYNFGGFKIDWACNAPTAPPNTEFEADVTQTCDGLVYFSDLSSNGADGWSWDFGDGSTDTVQHPSHVYSQSGTYSVTLIASNAVGSDTLVLSNLVSVVLAEAPNGEDDDICPGEQGTLIAEGPGEHRWYISALGNSVLHIGDTFVTPIVQQSTAYYVEAMVESSARGVGPASNAFGSGGYLPSPQVMYFDVFEECVLESVKVYAYTGGTRTFILLDANDDLIADTSMFLSPGEHVVPLEFLLNPGSDYQLGISPNSTVNLYRNTSGADYPYSMDGVLSITQAGGTAPNESYFFFYDWQVRARCISERSILAASTGICTGIAERYDGLFKVFPNPNQGHFTFEGNLQSGVMSIFDHTGRLVLSQVIGAQNSVQVNLAHCGSGIYLLEYARQDGVVQREKLILQ
jgi:PKD repeat protein